MEFQLFLQDVAECIRERIGDDATVNINAIRKNNGIVLSGLCIRQNDVNAAPTIYMEPYYSKYMMGEDIEDIADDILDVYRENSLEKDFDAGFYKEYDKVKDRLYCKLINYEMNKEMLEEVPYGKYWDLAVVPYYAFSDVQIGNASILVKNEHLNMWKVSANEVLETAISNTRSMKFEIKPIFRMILDGKISEGEVNINDISNESDSDMLDEKYPMQVATNKSRYYGAVIMIFKEELAKAAELFDDDYYIIPSSVHEVILVSKQEALSREDIDSMIRQVNDTELQKDEVLSDHAYLYSRQEEVLIF